MGFSVREMGIHALKWDTRAKIRVALAFWVKRVKKDKTPETFLLERFPAEGFN